MKDQEATVMGYILPIEQHANMNYHHRIIKQKTDPYVIERPFPVILEEKHRKLLSENERINKNNTCQKGSRKRYNFKESDLRWMGKGKHINEKI